MYIDRAVSCIPMATFKQGVPAGQVAFASLDSDALGCIWGFPSVTDSTSTSGWIIWWWGNQGTAQGRVGRCRSIVVPKFKKSGGQNIEVVIPLQTILSSQVVLDCERISKAQLDHVLFLLTQLACSGGWSELNLAFQVFRNGRFGGWKSNINPN